MKKSFLAVFDFDHTITNDYSLAAFRNVSRDSTSQAQKMLTETSTDIVDYAKTYYNVLKKHGMNINNIYESLKTVEVAPGIDLVLNYLKDRNCEVIITSDNLSLNVNEWLRIHNFSDVFQKVCALPSRVTEQDELEVEPYHTHNCSLSHKSMCKGGALESYIEERKQQGITFSRVGYFGDSYSDLCAFLRLSENDICFPRKGFVLDNMITGKTDTNVSKIKAKIVPWSNGLDIIEVLTKIF